MFILAKSLIIFYIWIDSTTAYNYVCSCYCSSGYYYVGTTYASSCSSSSCQSACYNAYYSYTYYCSSSYSSFNGYCTGSTTTAATDLFNSVLSNDILDTGAIIGIVIGAIASLAVLIVIIVVIIIVCKRKRSRVWATPLYQQHMVQTGFINTSGQQWQPGVYPYQNTGLINNVGLQNPPANFIVQPTQVQV